MPDRPRSRLRALIYVRVSSDRAGGRSPEEQEADGREVCKRNDWVVQEVLRDSVGASRRSKESRPGWATVKQRIAAREIDVLVTWEASRANRDVTDYAELRDLCFRAGVLWSYGGRTYDLADESDRFTTVMDAAIAEREAGETSLRVRRAVRANAEAGRPHGRVLFGYRRIYDPETKAFVRQEAHPLEAEAVRETFDRFAAGEGVKTIARGLNSKGVTTRRGAPWTDAQVRRMLKNPAYAGQLVFQGKVVREAVWDGIVPMATFDAVQARLELGARTGQRSGSRARLLTGVGRCGVCGAKIHVLHDKARRDYYTCRDRYCVSRDLAKLDAYVSAVLIELLERPDLVDVLKGRDGQDPALAKAEADLLRLQGRLDEATEAFVAGELSAARLGRVESLLVPQIEQIESEIRRSVLPLKIEVPAGAVGEWWDSLASEQQKAIVGATVASVVILPTGRGSRSFNPDHVRIEWRR